VQAKVGERARGPASLGVPRPNITVSKTALPYNQGKVVNGIADEGDLVHQKGRCGGEDVAAAVQTSNSAACRKARCCRQTIKRRRDGARESWQNIFLNKGQKEGKKSK